MAVLNVIVMLVTFIRMAEDGDEQSSTDSSANASVWL